MTLLGQSRYSRMLPVLMMSWKMRLNSLPFSRSKSCKRTAMAVHGMYFQGRYVAVSPSFTTGVTAKNEGYSDDIACGQ
ncbi:hypothetical protein [Methanooceanicella nereidis]|uniref:hypothetical protein n=1 Tax=Methanooceanicella nereidis TaxID=2052831 RepID=UPI001E3807D1|nr:hypothetical protein [Methanocella sp. CWC-04]